MDIIQVQARAGAGGQGTIAGVTGTNAPGSFPGGKPGDYVAAPVVGPVTIVAAQLEDNGGGDWDILVTFSEAVNGFDPTTVAPFWTAKKGVTNLPLTGAPVSPGDDFIRLSFVGPPVGAVTFTIPNGSHQIIGISGQFVKPGTYPAAPV